VTEVEAAVLDAVDAAELVDDLRALVAMPSIGGTEAEVEAQRWCAARLRDLGLHVDHWPLDLPALRSSPEYTGEEVHRQEAWGCVGVLGDGEASPALALCGHVDVVPPGDLDRWVGRDPWTLRAADGRLYGRGTADMKAGVAAILGAVAALQRSGVRLRRPLAVHTVVGEEDGGLGAHATLARGHTADACVIAEPTGGDLVVANAGALTFRIEVAGLATHGSTRTSGVSALDGFATIHEALRALEAERNARPPELFGHLDLVAPLSVGRVRAGDWASSVPDLLVAEGRYGVLPGETVHAAREAFEAAVERACRADGWLRDHPARVSWVGGQFASGALPAEHPLSDSVGRAVVDAGGRAPRPRGAPYGSDLRLYAAAGVPTLQFGPGAVEDAHAADEHVALDEVVVAARALALAALRLCGTR
jgi:acetylornithine deacetylase